ncbi:MAG TPA: ATP-binding protein, partial [Candidatus Nitrosopolaris sp.]|nr:ATP-binding protein [Candidatus Nitrosopolaris sp.]
MKRGGWWPDHGVAVCGLGCAVLAVVAWAIFPSLLADGVVAVAGLLAGFVASSSRRPGVPKTGPSPVAVTHRRAEEERVASIARERAARAEAERERDFAQLVLANAPIGIGVLEGPEHRVRLVNRCTVELSGTAAEKLLGRSIEELVPDVAHVVRPVVDRVYASGRAEGLREVAVPLRNGTTIYTDVTYAPLPGTGGKPAGVIYLAQDVSERKRAEADRQGLLAIAERARAAAESANRAKDEFLATLSHELRNPLAAIRNAVITACFDEPQRERAIEIAWRQVDQLVRIVEDLLEVTRVTQGRIQLRKERVSLASVVEQAVERIRPQLDDRGHTLSVALTGGELQVEGDPARLAQVLDNLLTNAAKYTGGGGRIAVVGEPQGEEIVLRVRDNGRGISVEMLPRVFDLFAQAEGTLDRADCGLGIGLTLVQKLVELHGGRVAAFSDGPGTGAEFVVRLPAPTSSLPTTEESAPAAAVEGHARVLVVEDNVDVADSLAMLLELFGHRVQIRHDGLAALAAVQTETFDIVLLDIGLPGMDGYDVARRIRGELGPARPALVALTGYGRDEDKARARAAGFDQHLVKPVDPDVLGPLV